MIETDALPGALRLVAGADVSYDRGSPALYAAVVVLDAESLEVVDVAHATTRAEFPYVPGYLSFRELPPLLAAFERLRLRPDLVLCDGHGRAHPRRFGLACHFGVLVDLPTIGCAKSRLIGDYDEPAAERGSWSPLVDREETIGAALRTQDGRNVVYVSTGHRISLASAIRVILACAPKYRLPEPQRLADRLSKQELVR